MTQKEQLKSAFEAGRKYQECKSNLSFEEQSWKMTFECWYEELEVPVAGVTDDSPIQKLLDWIDKNKDGLHEYTLGVIKSIAESYDTPCRLSVTGNKPLKTRGRACPRCKGICIHKDGCSNTQEKEYIEGSSAPIDTLDKETLLKQAKDNPTPEEFLEDKYAIYREGGKFDVSPQEIYKWMEEYLRLCTGGGENNTKR